MITPKVQPPRHDPPLHDAEFERWPANIAAVAGLTMPGWTMPGWGRTIWRGICGSCPRCGQAPIFDGYLKVFAKCRHCAAPLGEMPADDAPPYVAMVIVLQVLALFCVFAIHGSFVPGIVTAIALLAGLAGICMVALRLAKGAVIGILLKLGLRREALRG